MHSSSVMAPIFFSSPYTRHTYFNGKSPSQMSSGTTQFFNTARYNRERSGAPRAFLFGESNRMGYAPRVLAPSSVRQGRKPGDEIDIVASSCRRCGTQHGKPRAGRYPRREQSSQEDGAHYQSSGKKDGAHQ